jgi:hypothetical protein
MKKFLAMVVLMFASCSVSMAWNCTVAGEGRVQVPASYTGNGVGDGNNQVVSQGGLNFACLPDPIPTPAPTTGTNANTNSNTNNSNSTSTSGSTSTSTATGGNATATGGNSTSNQTQGQKQGQSQSSNNQSAGGSVSNVGNSVENIAAPKIPVATADAPPVFSTVNCFKGFSGGAQTAVAGLSFGGGGVDKNCAAERAAQDYLASGNRLAFCKVMVTTKQSKDAHVSLEDCMNVPVRPIVVPLAAPVPAPIVPQITVNIPQPQVVYLTPPPAPVPVVSPAKPVHAARKKIEQPKPCYVIQDQCVVVGHKVTGEK